MKERGMIFNGEMVRAILDGRKTQTRRIIKNQREGECWTVKPAQSPRYAGHTHDWWLPTGTQPYSALPACPHGAVGDRIWVRETFSVVPDHDEPAGFSALLYAADGVGPYGKWTPSIHMPRLASRILLEITDVRVERLRNMSQDDARAEGVIAASGPMEAGLAFRELWDSIYGIESWKVNPWVWVIEFKRVEGGAA